MRHVMATAEDHGLRVDIWLARNLTPLSRSRIQTLLAQGHIRVDGAIVRPGTQVRAGMSATIDRPAPSPTALAPEPIPISILYEDRDLIVLDKPPGLVVHPAPGHCSGTLVNALLHHCRDLAGIGGELRPGIVHRLDKDTSGLLVVAKNQIAMTRLADMFKARQVSKFYLAIVRGCPNPPRGRIEKPIGRSTHDRKKMAVRTASGSGREAVSEYRVERNFRVAALVRVRIHTGRTHQIRVHMAHLGHPVLGDLQYGRRGNHPLPDPAPRHMLHAAELIFRHPVSGREMHFSAPMPPDMQRLLDSLGKITSA